MLGAVLPGVLHVVIGVTFSLPFTTPNTSSSHLCDSERHYGHRAGERHRSRGELVGHRTIGAC